MEDITSKRNPYSPTRNSQAISRQTYFIGKNLHCKMSDCKASITVEAALMLPMVLFLFLFFVFMIHASVIATSLQSAVTNTVKQVAAHMYPIELMMERSSDVGSEGSRPWLRKPPAMTLKMTARHFLERFSNALPPPVNKWVSGNVVDWTEEQVEVAGEWGQARVGEGFIRPLLVQYGIQGMLQEERIRVTHVKLPDIMNKEEPYVAVEIEYDLPMRVPFLFKTVTIAARASERIWIGDGPQSGKGYQNLDGREKKSSLELLSLTPNPLLPGRKAKLTAKTRPNEKVELIVYYKSRKSEAKHVGWAVADADGHVSWEWHVSGNTTSGTWRLVVHTEDGPSVERQLNVK